MEKIDRDRNKWIRSEDRAAILEELGGLKKSMEFLQKDLSDAVESGVTHDEWKKWECNMEIPGLHKGNISREGIWKKISQRQRYLFDVLKRGDNGEDISGEFISKPKGKTRKELIGLIDKQIWNDYKADTNINRKQTAEKYVRLYFPGATETVIKKETELARNRFEQKISRFKGK